MRTATTTTIAEQLERAPQRRSSVPADTTITLPPPSPLPASTAAAAVAAAATAKSGGGARPSSKFGTVNYSVDEMRRLVAKVRAVMPVGGDDWLHVAYQFNYLRPEAIPYREAESLKRKFKKMYCSRGQRLPAYVEEAKELRRLLSLRAAAPEPKVESEQLPSPAEEAVQLPPVAVATTARRRQANGAQEAAEDARQQVAATAGADPQPTVNSGLSDACAVASRLSAMEDEYRRAAALRRAARDDAAEASASSAAAAAPAATTTVTLPVAVSQQQLHHIASDLLPAAPETPLAPHSATSDIIAMLQHSIERKRRTAEEQVLSESERVRKERKKRKMEQVLYSIHQEQRERELLGGDPAATGAVAGHVAEPSTGAAALLGSTTPSLSQSRDGSGGDPSAVGVMEVVLQFLVAQQQESAARLQQEQERRERKHRIKEQRRREKERRRRQETRELMLLMAAAMGDKFPDALRRHLAATPSSSDSEGHDDGDEDNDRELSSTSSSAGASAAATTATSVAASRASAEVHANGDAQQQALTAGGDANDAI